MGIRDRLRALVPARQKALGGNMPIPSSWPIGWWQSAMDKNYTPNASGSSVVEACIAAYAQTIAQLPGYHYRTKADGSTERVKTGTVAKLLKRPNEEQSSSDFLLNLIYGLLYTGNAYALRAPDGSGMYLLEPRATTARRVMPENEIFYQTNGAFAEMLSSEESLMIPARYVAHVRLYTPYDPLIGVTPLTAAAPAIMAHNAITNHQASFFSNMARPSGVLSTEMALKKDQIEMLRKSWEEHSKGLNAGGVPILSAGLSWQPLTMSSQDAELVSAWRMSTEEISRVFRVPPMMINSLENASFQNAETLMSFWLASGLGFVVNHVELALSKMFNLPDTEGVELDTEVLLRTDMQARMEALGKAVTQGIYSPNEAREREGLPPVEGGESPRVQQQMVALNYVPPPDTSAAPPTAAAPAPAKSWDEDDLKLLPMMVRSYKSEVRINGR